MLLRIFSFLKNKTVRIFVFYIFSFYWKAISANYKSIKRKKKKPKLMFGPVNILNNKFWNDAMKMVGYDSKTVIRSNQSIINEKDDFEQYFDEIIKENYTSIPYFLRYLLSDFIVFDYLLKNYDIIHKDLSYFVFRDKFIWNKEAELLNKFGVKIIAIPFGGDFLQLSKIKNYSLKHVNMFHYPQSEVEENTIRTVCNYWTYNSDVLIASNILDGKLKWDLIPFVNLCIDINKIPHNKIYSENDGLNEEVVIVHSPNHRLWKGTEFIIDAINQLKSEGFKIKFILLEKVKNNEVRRILNEEADILVEQIIVGYALSGVEGLAYGIPTISNLENDEYLRIYRRYSYLNECPILSATPETVKDRIKTLVLNPKLRKELGQAGRRYAEKYHSETSAQFMFSKIYDKIWFEKDVDLMNLFHPLNPNSYNNQSPKIEHPLIENKIPESLMKMLKIE